MLLRAEKGKDEEEDLLPFEVDATGQPITQVATGGEGPDDDDDEQADDEDRAHLGAGEDAEAKKRERQARKRRRDAAMRRDKEELKRLQVQNQELSQRLARLEHNAGSMTMAQLDDRISVAQRQVQEANNALRNAMARGNPDAHVQAMEVRDRARDVLNYLSGIKQRLERQPQPGPQARQPQPEAGGGEDAELPPEVRKRAAAFMKKNSWYDPGGGDTDSRILLALDDEVMNNGFDPSQSEYWDELDRLARERLPHRFNGRRAPAVGGSSGDGAARREVGKNMVRVTPERKAAMIEAGVWDDPKKRQKMLRAYQKYDNEHANDRRA